MQQFSVTKYDPARRNEKGHFLDNDWTCASEIGHDIGGKKLELNTCLAVEAAYAEAVLMFFKCSGLPHLRITSLGNSIDKSSAREMQEDEPELYDPLFFSSSFQENQAVGADEIALLTKMNLRNVIWCKLEVDEKFLIHFGWHFYMYIGCTDPCESVILKVSARGLFVEPFSSPYGRPENFYAPAQLTTFPKHDTDGQGVVDTTMEGFTISQLRDAFGYSPEHPFFGNFEIDHSNVASLQDLLGFPLDLDHFDYTINTSG